MTNPVPRDSLKLSSYARRGVVRDVFARASIVGSVNECADTAVRMLVNAGASVDEIVTIIAPHCDWSAERVAELLSRMVRAL